MNVTSLVGTTLNTDFEVDTPKRLQIVKFDRPTAETKQFEVASIDGVWRIPSKQDYPADATQQMAAAANALIDRKVLRVAAETAQDHEALGVVDPQSAKLDSNSEGVGTRVIMSDADDKTLVDMIIGKKVKDAEGQRYVRNTNQDVVYIVELDPESLSTNFDDWIEDDLLQLSPFDLTQRLHQRLLGRPQLRHDPGRPDRPAGELGSPQRDHRQLRQQGRQVDPGRSQGVRQAGQANGRAAVARG